MSRRGQTEISFQWVFVLIAGVALLALLLGFARTCAKTGTDEARTIGLRGSASMLASAAWSGDSVRNTTLPDAVVSCRVGSLAIEAAGEPQYLDKAPIFLPPMVGGRARVVTREVALSPSTPSEIPVGGIAYILDTRTSYVIVDDSNGDGAALLRNMPADESIVFIPIDEIGNAQAIMQRVPGSPRTIVFAIVGTEADLSRVDISLIPDTVEVRGVALQRKSAHGGTATFYRRDATNHLVAFGTLPYAHELLGLGIIIGADRDNARCATESFADRARTIVKIAELRATDLANPDDVPDPVCQDNLQKAAVRLRAIGDKPNAGQLLGALFESESDLFYLQSILLTRSGNCPGVA